MPAGAPVVAPLAARTSMASSPPGSASGRVRQTQPRRRGISTAAPNLRASLARPQGHATADPAEVTASGHAARVGTDAIVVRCVQAGTARSARFLGGGADGDVPPADRHSFAANPGPVHPGGSGPGSTRLSAPLMPWRGQAGLATIMTFT